ncbi:MAG: hypothetical protein ACC608_00340 [Anaerofustis sp.]
MIAMKRCSESTSLTSFGLGTCADSDGTPWNVIRFSDVSIVPAYYFGKACVDLLRA